MIQSREWGRDERSESWGVASSRRAWQVQQRLFGSPLVLRKGCRGRIYDLTTSLRLQCDEQQPKDGWSGSGNTRKMTKFRYKRGLWETRLKQNQSVVTRKEVPEKTIRFGVWDLRYRGRMTGLEPRWGLRMRDMDLSAQRDKWTQKTELVSYDYKEKWKTRVLEAHT